MPKIYMMLLAVTLHGVVQAQSWDTLKVMTYNLLYYGEVTSFCTSTNNNINDKDIYFKTIAKHVKPDLLLVNEMGASVVYADRIIQKVLNTDGVTKYKRAPVQNNSFSDLVNGVFYNKQKLVLHKQDKVVQALNSTSLVRAIDICTFYYKDPLLESSSDTVFLYLVGMHLKAGDASSDQSDRDLATEAVMAYIQDNYPPGYYIAAGDMNVSASSEAAFQNFLSNSHGAYRFKDPLISGGWSGSSSFAYAHTQSTHTSGDCFSGGGMDDRFDIVLVSGQVLEDTGAVSYVPESYTVVGNDGQHYNMAVNQGTNNSVPSAVLGALYEMSDHLPVTLDLKIRQIEADTDTIPTATRGLNVPAWKVRPNGHGFMVRQARVGDQCTVMDLTGRVLFERTITSQDEFIDLQGNASGIYLIRLSSGQHHEAFKVLLR
jgi:hypothetical protein